MDSHSHSHNNTNLDQVTENIKDPVCEMTVDPKTAKPLSSCEKLTLSLSIRQGH